MVDAMFVLKVLFLLVYPFVLTLFIRRHDNVKPYLFLLVLFLVESTAAKSTVVALFSVWALLVWVERSAAGRQPPETGGEIREPRLPSWEECLGGNKKGPKR